MSQLEEIVFEAHELGLRDALFKEVSTIRSVYPRMDLNDVYSQALTNVKAGVSQKSNI